ncbi:homoserine kinase type II [Paenibacillus algorifonticola]|uniref:Homoserine kinase type II n=1 Tax=Paenibacillus algorifonticola TaxID=684063 RepID=A0A1I2BPT8_9BACL|nr:phosphotransferase [Paenibacillus algorifonticola]SFE58057.1 homoserine kinase type II [Paenibacillus algorifonticola]
MIQHDFSTFLDQYELGVPWEIAAGDSGMNNTTRIVQAGNNRYVLRIYNNHQNKSTVLLEHEVLFGLLEQGNRHFDIPKPVANRAGQTVTEAKDGKLATLCHFIEGKRPSVENISHIKGLGIATAALCKGLNAIRPQGEPIYDPYYKLEQSYEAISIPAMLDIASEAGLLPEFEEQVVCLQQERELLQNDLKSIAELPRQWIHGDLNFSNSVARGDAIVGLLDFEFCTVDVRAMELAVVIVDLIDWADEGQLERIALFCEGFGSELRLTAEEASGITLLLKLRMLDVALHFMTRWREQLDEAAVLQKIVIQAAKIVKWTGSNERHLKALFLELLAGVDRPL